MSVLLLNSSFPPEIGGVETYMAEVARALVDRDVWAVGPLADGHEALDRTLEYPVHRYPKLARTVATVEAWPRAIAGVTRTAGGNGRGAGPSMSTRVTLLLNRNLLRHVALQAGALAEGCDHKVPAAALVGTVLPSGGTARLLAEMRGVPYAVFTHAAEVLEYDRGWRRARLLRRVLNGASRVAAVSRFTRDEVVRRGVDPDRILLCPPGIDARPFLEPPSDLDEVRARYRVAGRRVVLCHGRLDPRKGHDVVIDAWPEVLRAVPDAAFLVTGDGEARDALAARIAARGLGEHVLLAGRVPQDDLPALYHLADVVVMVSRQIGVNVEGFGIVCLEGGAAGKPVLGGRSGGVPDAVVDGETGFLVDPDDPGDVARRLVALLTDRELSRRLGEAGRARVLAEFDRPAFARRVRRLADETVADGPFRREPW